MCYEFVLSTDAPLDLASLNTETVFFEPSNDKRYVHNVKYQYKYRIATGAPNCCSCHLHILQYNCRDFDLDYLKECYFDEDNDEDTYWLIEVIKKLVNEDYQVDSYVDMEGDKPEEKQTVYINDVDKETFFFVDGVYYDYQT